MIPKTKKFSYIELMALTGFQVLLFFAFLARIDDVDSAFRFAYVIKLSLPDDKPSNDSFLKKISAPDVLKEWKDDNKKIISVDLTGDKTENQKRFDFIRSEARRM